ncbi:MAG: hypothetical protein GY811_20700 [Myxococcales bacterium]|nr:hypothetical protein [Myxococcales bacterium]
MDSQRLIEILRRSSAVDDIALNAAVMEYERWGNDIVRNLLEKQAVTETDLILLLSTAWGVPAVALATYRPSEALIEHFASEFADAHRAIPLRVEGSFLDVAFESPTTDAIDAVRVHTQLNVRPHIASPKSIDRLLAQFYGRMNVGGYHVDPRVTSGNFLRSDMLDIAEGEQDVGEGSMSIAVDLGSFDDVDIAREGEVAQLRQAVLRAKQRIQLLEAHVARDEDVLRRLFGYLVDKGIGTEQGIVALLS